MNKQVLGFWNVVKGILILCLITYLIQILFSSKTTFEDIKSWTFYNFYFGVPFAYGNFYLIKALDHKWPWNDGAKKRAMYGIIISTIANVTLIIILLVLYVGVYKGLGVGEVFSARYKGSILIAFIITLIISLLGYTIGFFKQVEVERKLNAKLTEEKTTAELNALKAQVDPHFLFNSFNVLSGLIDESPEQAQKFLGGLSKIYRYILENRNEDLCKLKEEIEFAKQYLALQQTRFENSVHIDIILSDEALEKMVPSLSLQLLLENAIKHNAFDDKEPLKISISEKNGSIAVSNNRKQRTHISETSGMGLENINKRYMLHSKEGFRIEETKDSFKVLLPLI